MIQATTNAADVRATITTVVDRLETELLRLLLE
jgi:hypothetical protein